MTRADLVWSAVLAVICGVGAVVVALTVPVSYRLPLTLALGLCAVAAAVLALRER